MTLNQPLRVGIGGPVGSGKTALTLALCRALRDRYQLAVVTNDIYTEEDAQFLVRNEALAPDRIIGVETGGCPHTAIREDASINLEAVDRLARRFGNLDIVFVESGGDNLAATFSPELSDLTIYVIDVAAGDKIPRKGGPGITRSDLLVINKIDLAPMVGASLEVMDRDARKMRGERPFVFTNLKTGQGLDVVVRFVIERGMVGAAVARRADLGAARCRATRGPNRCAGRCDAPSWDIREAILDSARRRSARIRTCSILRQIKVLAGRHSHVAWIVRRSNPESPCRASRWIAAGNAARPLQALFIVKSIETGKSMQRRTALKRLALSAALAVAGLTVGAPALAADTIKVGVLHSLSGTMAISETVLKDVTLMAIDEINAKGGVLGKKLEPVVVDPGVELAAVRRKGAAADRAGQGRRRVRLLDVGVAQVGAAGVRGTERPALLPGAVRRRGAVEERVLHRRRAEPAGDSRGRVPDEQGRRRRQALGAARHRLRLSAHDEQDPARVPEVEGRRRQGHRREVHAVRPQRLPDDRRRHQEVRRRRQDRGGLDHQRRLQRAVLQGARQPGPQGHRRPGRRVLGRRGRAARRRHQAAGRATSPRGTTSCRSRTRPTTRSRRSGPTTPRPRSCRAPTSR